MNDKKRPTPFKHADPVVRERAGLEDGVLVEAVLPLGTDGTPGTINDLVIQIAYEGGQGAGLTIRRRGMRQDELIMEGMVPIRSLTSVLYGVARIKTVETLEFLPELLP